MKLWAILLIIALLPLFLIVYVRAVASLKVMMFPGIFTSFIDAVWLSICLIAILLVLAYMTEPNWKS